MVIVLVFCFLSLGLNTGRENSLQTMSLRRISSWICSFAMCSFLPVSKLTELMTQWEWIYHVKRHKTLAVCITELTEDLEELRSEKALLLQRFEYAEDAGAEAFRKDIATMEAGLKKLEAQEQKYSAELDKALDEYAELKAQAADFDPVELYKARQVIRPALEKAVKKQLEDTMQEKPSLIVLLSAKQEASRLLGEDTEDRQVRQLIMRRQKEQRTVPQNQSKKKEHWER